MPAAPDIATAGRAEFTAEEIRRGTFLPNLIAHAADPYYKLCGKDGPLAKAYLANTGFDRAKKGCIVVQDLSDAITRATEQMGAEWDMLRYKIRQEQERCKAADGSA